MTFVFAEFRINKFSKYNNDKDVEPFFSKINFGIDNEGIYDRKNERSNYTSYHYIDTFS